VAIIKINKFEAARRQVDAAIRMIFSAEDPVGVHTLAMAGFRILRDLASQHDDSYMEKVIDLMIKPGKKAAFWGAMNSFSNFLKHADRDSAGIHDGVDEEVNDVTLFMACLYYQDLGHQFTPEMSALVGWFTALHPGFLFENANPKFRAAAEAAGASIKALSRREQLAFGKQLITLARNMVARS
jgi:hypothetical protein